MRLSVWACAALVALAALACGGGSDDSQEVAQLRQQVEELQRQLFRATTSRLAGPPTTPAAAADVPDSAPTTGTPDLPSSTIRLSQALVRYIGNTEGDGVSLRSDCRDSARGDGGWIEGVEVLVEQHGTGQCDGWSIARVASTSTWVRDEYLVEAPPAVQVPTPTATPTPEATTAATPEAAADPEQTPAPASATQTASPLVVSKAPRNYRATDSPGIGMISLCVQYVAVGENGERCEDVSVWEQGVQRDLLQEALTKVWLDCYDLTLIGEPLPLCWLN